MSGQTEGMPQGDGMQDLVDMLLAHQGSGVLPQLQNLVGENYYPSQQMAEAMDFEDFSQIQPMLEVQPTGNHQLQPAPGAQPHMYQAPGPPQNYYRQQGQGPQLHSQSQRAGEQMFQYSSASSCQDPHLHPTEGVLAHQNPLQLTPQDVQPLGYLPANPEVQCHQVAPGPDQSTTDMDDIMSTIGYTDGNIDITPSIESFLNKMKDQPGMPSSDNAPPLPEGAAVTMGMTPLANPTPNLGGCPTVIGDEMTAGMVQLGSSAATRSAVPWANHTLHPVNSTIPRAVVSPVANPIAPVDNSPIASRAAQPSPGPSAVPTGMAAPMRNNMPRLACSTVSQGIHQTSQDMNLVSSTREAQKGSQRGSSAAKKRTKEPRRPKKKQQAKSQIKVSTGGTADSKKATTSEEAQVSATDNGSVKSFQLPEKWELKVRMYFQTHLLKEEKVTSRDGCLVYHNNPWRFQEPNLDCTELVFPEVHVHVKEEQPSGHVKKKQPSGHVKKKQPSGHVKKKQPRDRDVTKTPEEAPSNQQFDPDMTETQKKATDRVLAALAKGIHIFCDDDGNIHAERYCRSHVYCYSIVATEGFQPVLAPTENQPGREHQSPKRYFKKLELNEKVMVFNNSALMETLRGVAQTGKFPDDLHDPAVYFTFGQTWDKGFPISNSLVYMKINPMFAKAMQDHFATPKGDPEGDPVGDPKVNSFPCSEASLLESSMSILSLSMTSV